MTRNQESISVPSLLCLFGFAFSRATSDLLSYRLIWSNLFWQPVPGDVLFGVSFPTTALVSLLFARRILAISRFRFIGEGCAAALCLAAIPLCVVASEFAYVVASIASGAASSLMTLCWMEMYTRLDRRRALLYLAGSVFMGSSMAWLLRYMEAVRLFVAICTFAVLSSYCLVKAKVLFGNVFPRIPREAKIPWRIICAFGICEFMYGAWESSSGFDWRFYPLGVILASFAIVAFNHLPAEKKFPALTYQSAVLCMTCGLTVSMECDGGIIANLLSVSGYTALYVFASFYLCDVSRKSGIPILVLYCPLECVSLLGIAGADTAQSLDAALPNCVMAPIATLVVIAAMASVLLLIRGEKTEHKDIAGRALFGANGERASLDQRCDCLAYEYGLTRREREVLKLLAQRKSAVSIRSELGIAESTLRSHIQHIHQKMDVHAQKEILELFDEESRGFLR